MAVFQPEVIVKDTVTFYGFDSMSVTLNGSQSGDFLIAIIQQVHPVSDPQVINGGAELFFEEYNDIKVRVSTKTITSANESFTFTNTDTARLTYFVFRGEVNTPQIITSDVRSGASQSLSLIHISEPTRPY